MALDITVGQTVTRTVVALDAAGNDDPNATITLSEGSGGTVLTLSGESGTNPVTVTYTGVAEGSTSVTATATDPDGNTVTATDAVTVSAAAPPSTDATSVEFS